MRNYTGCTLVDANPRVEEFENYHLAKAMLSGYLERFMKPELKPRKKLIQTNLEVVEFNLKPDIDTGLSISQRQELIMKGRLHQQSNREEIRRPI